MTVIGDKQSELQNDFACAKEHLLFACETVQDSRCWIAGASHITGRGY